MLTDQSFRKLDILIGESMFFDPRFGVNAESARLFREHPVHEMYRFFYIVEGAFTPNDTPTQKNERIKRLQDFGCQLDLYFIRTLGQTARPVEIALPSFHKVCAPFFCDEFAKKIGRDSKLFISVRWHHLQSDKLQPSDLADFLNSLTQ